MHKITKVLYEAGNTVIIAADAIGDEVVFQGEGENIVPVLIEMHARLDLVTYSWEDLIRVGAQDQGARQSKDSFPGVTVTPEGEMLLMVSIVDGDDGALLTGQGSNVITAIADLIRNQDYPQQMTPQEFVAEMIYGRERLSNEKLEAELEGVLTPQKGSW